MAAGELPFVPPELWILNDEDYPRAKNSGRGQTPKLKIMVRGFVVAAKRLKANSLHVGNVKGTIGSIDYAGTHLCDLRVHGRVGCRHLFHAGHFAPRRGSFSRWSNRRIYGHGRDRSETRWGCGAYRSSDTVLKRFSYLGLSILGNANLPGHLARPAGSGGAAWRCAL